MSDFWKIETRAGAPLVSADRMIVPFAQSLSFRIPVVNLGLVWNRPVSILIRDGNGQEQVLPISDVTRRVELALLFSSLASILALRVIFGWLRRTH